MFLPIQLLYLAVLYPKNDLFLSLFFPELQQLKSINTERGSLPPLQGLLGNGPNSAAVMTVKVALDEGIGGEPPELGPEAQSPCIPGGGSRDQRAGTPQVLC